MLGAIQNKEANNTSILSSKLHQMDLSSNLFDNNFHLEFNQKLDNLYHQKDYKRI